MSTFKIELGKKVVDFLTGFKGKVTSRVEYLTGCKQYHVQPKVGKDGKYPEGCYFDEDRLLVKPDKKDKNKGGPQSDAPTSG